MDEQATQMPPWIGKGVEAIEGSTALDGLADRMAPIAQQLDQGPQGPMLRGEWLGHSLHPMLTDVALGCWMSAGLLDVVGGRGGRRAARRLIGIGLLSVPATAASGLVDWSRIERRGTQRAGVAHAAGNTVVALCYFRSWRSRRRGKNLRGIVWSTIGATLAVGTGYLGGHLAYARGVGQGERGTLPPDHSERVDSNAGGGTTFGGDGNLHADDPLTTALLLDALEASQRLGVEPEQIEALVVQGVLVPVEHVDGEPRFRDVDVVAARLIGG